MKAPHETAAKTPLASPDTARAAGATTQRIEASQRTAAQQVASDGLNDSPRMLAQRKHMQETFGAERISHAGSGGLPAQLKAGIEQLSGVSMEGVRVHYNSSKPAQLQAHAYAQGSDIHLAPGQDRHLPHEAWHLTQQKQGRVAPTMQANGVPINDNPALEQEADRMGARAAGLSDTAQRVAAVKPSGGDGGGSPVQRRIVDYTNGKDIDPEKDKVLVRKASKALKETDIYKNLFTNLTEHKFVLPNEVEARLNEKLKNAKQILFIDPGKEGVAMVPFPVGFLIASLDKIAPNPKNFGVAKPDTVPIKKLHARQRGKKIPENKGHKPIGYVANIASYYAEAGVKTIAKQYFEHAISGSNDEKGNRLAIVAGLNSFEPLILADYLKRVGEVNSAVDGFQMPDLAANVAAFGFLWQPAWTFNKKPLAGLNGLRQAIRESEKPQELETPFRDKQKSLSSNYPYGIFRETVTASPYTKGAVDALKAYNNPVYIHSGDGDSISLKVPDDDDTDLSGKGVLDKFSEEIGKQKHKPLLAIGGYNFHELKREPVMREIVKADDAITHYKDNTLIDKKGKIDLAKLKGDDSDFVQRKFLQIRHNSQVGNRYDRIIRSAISTVYPKMLYPTEPNMLIMANYHVGKQSYNLFDNPIFNRDGTLPKHNEGKLWGKSASEGRVLKENLEKMYIYGDEETGHGFTQWIDGASLPTDPRGFDRHLLISGYEKYAGPKEKAPPFEENSKDKAGKPKPLDEAAVHQAQSYASAYRLTELYCQARGIERDSKEGTEVAKQFAHLEEVIKKLMLGQDVNTGDPHFSGLSGQLVSVILQRITLAYFGR